MSNIKLQLRSVFDLTQEYLQDFVQLLSQTEYRQASYFQLPLPTPEQERNPLAAIQVQSYQGDAALGHIKNSFLDFHKDGELSGKLAKRHPGIILLPRASFTDLEPYLSKINELKTEFKQKVLTLDNNDARFDAVHSAVPGLMTLAFYRHIHFESQAPYSVRFTWMQKHSTKSLTRKLALTMLERSSAYSNPRMIDQQQWQQLVEQEKRKVSSLGENEKLRIRRPIRVTPEVNVRFADNRRYHVSGAMPFIVFDDNPDIKLGELKNYEPKEDPRKREYEYLVERLYLARGE
ncbi:MULTISPECIES: DNA replication terminus site-binding protein [unclassified Pseudoalteromonas]|uniref:DNA replication terminus site-binding protein n=1 Tax=unclassified Pseudoalteromonas TaxID=194690 RepID=UPI000CF71CC9|nr:MULTISPECIES: DNA replication terminus site-binding protein [unclassified Pseudoalteromonas]MBS3797573.1 DNA replication terminus site-binding protein [Pseudoalteromonas sp. BDTF-M6]